MTRLERLLRQLGAAKLARRMGVAPGTVRRWAREEHVPEGRRPKLRAVEERRKAALAAAAEKREREEREQREAEKRKQKRAARRAAEKRAKEEAARKAAAEAERKRREAEQRAKEEAERKEAERKAKAEEEKQKRAVDAERKRRERAAEAERKRAEEAARPPAPPPPVRVVTREQATTLRAAAALGVKAPYEWREETQDERDDREEREAIQAEQAAADRAVAHRNKLLEWARSQRSSRGVERTRFHGARLVGERGGTPVVGVLRFAWSAEPHIANKFRRGTVGLAWVPSGELARQLAERDEVKKLQTEIVDWARHLYTTNEHGMRGIRFEAVTVGDQVIWTMVGTEESGETWHAYLIQTRTRNKTLQQKIAETPRIITAFFQGPVTLYWGPPENVRALESGVSNEDDAYEDLTPRTIVTDFSQLFLGKSTVTADFTELLEIT